MSSGADSNKSDVSLKGINFWPVILVAIPFTAVIVGVAMVLLTTLHPDDVVVADYYKDGMAINRRLELEHQAEKLGVKISLASVSPSSLGFAVNSEDTFLILNLYHVNDSSQDLSFTLQKQPNSEYSISADALIVLQKPGVWYLEFLSPESGWRVRTRTITPLMQLELDGE